MQNNIPPDENTKKMKKMSSKDILVISLIVAAIGCVLAFVIINFVWKRTPPTPVIESSTISSDVSSDSVSSVSSASTPSAESIEEEPAAYPTDKLFVTKGRAAYTDGEIVLRVPRLDLITPILDGTEPETLDRGVGLYDYAQLPGKSNRNTSMTAHRNIEFEFINTITSGDMIYLEYDGIEYAYEYEDTTIVQNDDWSIINCRDYAIVTLVSCHPINSSKQRMAVVGRLVSQKPIEAETSSISSDSSANSSSSAPTSSEGASSQETVIIESEPVPQSAVPASAKATVLVPVAGETVTSSNAGVVFDASNTAEGYVMVKYDGTATKLKVLITGPDAVQYQYSLHPGAGFEVFPLTAGNGSYLVKALENVGGTKYAPLHTETYEVAITNSLKPYLYPNQYVNFNANSKTVAKGETVAAGAKNDLEKVQNVYNYVIKNITYDDAKADAAVNGSIGGYLPVVDDILASGKGICFDYAAVMAAMLRSQNIPTRLEVGYASGNIYHAWITVYTPETGWVNGIIQFDGKKWKLMDPTFASNANSSKSIMQFIGNGSNYKTKYVY